MRIVLLITALISFLSIGCSVFGLDGYGVINANGTKWEPTVLQNAPKKVLVSRSVSRYDIENNSDHNCCEVIFETDNLIFSNLSPTRSYIVPNIRLIGGEGKSWRECDSFFCNCVESICLRVSQMLFILIALMQSFLVRITISALHICEGSETFCRD